MSSFDFSPLYRTVVGFDRLASLIGKMDTGGTNRKFLHRGIAERGFFRRFQLADHVAVTGAKLANGLLRIELKRELPEAMKPRKISIGEGPQVIEGGATKVRNVSAA